MAPNSSGEANWPLTRTIADICCARIAGLDPDAAGRDLRVLRAYRLGHVVCRQVVPDQAARIDPDAKRALGGVERRPADPRDAANLAQNVSHQEIAEPDLVEAAVRGVAA